MLSLVTVLALASASPNLDVALVARIYYPPGDKRMSHHEVYLCGLHGEARIKVSNTKEKAIQVRWTDHNHLLWVTQNDDYKTRLWSYDLRTRKTSSRLVPEFTTDSPRLTKGSADAHQSVEWEATSNDRRHPASVAIDPMSNLCGYVATIGTRKVRVDLSDPITNDVRGIFHDKKSNRAWILTYGHDSTTGQHYGLHLVDWATGKAKAIIHDAEDFDFLPDRAIYAVAYARETEPGGSYGKGRAVSTARAWAGNWKTGKTWTILGGLSWTTSISLRPN